MGLLDRVVSRAESLPSRTFFYAREKWGKSSLFAYAPGVIYFMTPGETGLRELISAKRIPETPYFPYDDTCPPTWEMLRNAVAELIKVKHGYRFFALDTANGAETMCMDYVRREYFGDSQKAFAAYGKGMDTCKNEWHALLRDLDALRSLRKMGIVFLAHSRVKKFEDPTAREGWDKYQPACQDKLWEITHKWADIICFGHFKTQLVENDAGKMRASENKARRIICFDQSPSWDAGNRYGITGELVANDGADKAFKAFAELVAKARGTGKPADPPASPPPPAAEDEALRKLRDAVSDAFSQSGVVYEAFLAEHGPALGFNGLPPAFDRLTAEQLDKLLKLLTPGTAA